MKDKTAFKDPQDHGLTYVFYKKSLEVGEETKLLPDSAFGNFLCTRAYASQSQKNPPFFLAFHTPRNQATAQGVIPQEHKKCSELPQLVKWAKPVYFCK